MNKMYFVIGASGAGKTTASQALEKERLDIQFCYPDKEQHIPTEEEMIKEYGGSSNWQKSKTVEWIKNVKEKYLNKKPALLDTQSRYEFIKEACEQNEIKDFRVILFDCEDSVRNQRIYTRGQAHLANTKMDDWARFLREDAKKHNCVIVDTTKIQLKDMATALNAVLG